MCLRKNIHRQAKEWAGDKPIDYNFNERILTIGEKPAVIPQAADALNRQVLLKLAVIDYQLEDDGLGITAEIFWGKLNEIGEAPPKEKAKRSLETAITGVNQEVQKSLGWKKFISIRGGAAHIIRKRS